MIVVELLNYDRVSYDGAAMMINRKLDVRSLKCIGPRREPIHLNYVLIVHLLTLWIIGALGVKDTNHLPHSFADLQTEEWAKTAESPQKSVPISHVVAIVGEPTYLPCDISTSHDGDSVHLVLWYRDNLDTSVYSVDARNRNFPDAERWSDVAVFSNRASFLHNKQPAELGVEGIREEDAGVYRCRVDFQIGQTRNSKVNLTVIVPPEKIVISDENGIGRETAVGPYTEGDDLKLFCDVYGGKPPPTVAWYSNDKYVNNETFSVDKDKIRSAITVRGLGRKDVSLQLTCTATNNNRSILKSSTVRVDMNFKPLKVEIIGSNQPLSAGKKYNISCMTYGSRPPANLTWWLNGQHPESDSRTTISSDGNATTSILSFSATKSDAGKYLTCRAENPIIGSEPIEDKWILKIHYKPEPQIKLGKSLNKDAIREGSDVYFDCRIYAEPSVYKVEWRHEGKALSHNITQGIIISNRSLVLQRVDRRSAGNYTCVGYNTEGDGASTAFYLRVMFAPTCKPNQTNVHGVAKQEKAKISCQVDANPTDVHFRWTFNNSAENVDVTTDHIVRSGTTSIVSYTPMTELDYGTLLCWASNSIGQQQVPCVYHIIPAGHPDMVHNCTTSNTSTTSFTVRCSEGFNGGLQQAFLLEVRESNSQELRANMSASIPQFSVTHLDSGALYQACIYAYNNKGRSEAMVVQAGTLRLPEKQLTSETERPRHHIKLTPMLSVMIGVVAALVIVAVIVMVVLRIQNASPDDQGKPHLKDLDKTTKSIPIQRELRFREGSSLLAEEKHPGSPFRKLDTTGELSEADEKNPDIIPQQVNGADEQSEHLRKRRFVSTIVTSPSRSLLEHPVTTSLGGHGSYVGYCKISSGIPMHEFTGLSTKHKSVTSIVQSAKSTSYQFHPMVYGTGLCTLPRQHWPSHGVPSKTMTVSPPVLYAGLGTINRTCLGSAVLPKEVEARGHGQCYIQSQKDATTSTPMVMAKRESSV